MTDSPKDIFERIYAQREEILAAFIAKYKCHPEDVVQVEQRTPSGWRWWVERRKEASVE